jgi:hypothetical protein
MSSDDLSRYAAGDDVARCGRGKKEQGFLATL